MYFTIYLKSKNNKNFIIFLKKLKFLFNNSLINYFNYQPLRFKYLLFSILKSPHVNKVSQEQFNIITFYRKINISTNYLLKLFIIFKTLLSSCFSTISIKIIYNILKKNISYNTKNDDNINLIFKKLDFKGDQYLLNV